MDIVWTAYMQYRASLRGFDRTRIEQILRQSTERYYDTVTQRLVVVGRHDDRLVLIPCDQEGTQVTPVTIHVTTRQQINFRLKTGRFEYGSAHDVL